MRSSTLLTGLLLAASAIISADAQTPAATAQQLFDAMAKHDVQGGQALFAPGASLGAIKPDGSAALMPADKWLARLGESKAALLERMWNPKTLEQGNLAVVWAEYDFHLDGKFTHCGIDSFNLVKTSTGWKILSVLFTRQTEGCAPSPLGPPVK